MNEEKYITIKELAKLKGVSVRAIRLSKGKYITREITVKGGKSFEILLSSIEPELQEKYFSKFIPILSEKQLPATLDFHKPDKAKIIALARLDLLNLWKNQRKNQQNKTQFDTDFLSAYNAQVLYPEIYAKLGNVSIGTLQRWKQILDYAKAHNKCIIFVTADVKDDWWDECKGEKRCSHKLKKEFYDNVNAEFHMYTPERFIDEAMKFYDLDYSEEIVEEVKMLERPKPKYKPRYLMPEFENRDSREMLVIRDTIREGIRITRGVEDFYNFLMYKYKISFSDRILDLIDGMKNEYDYHKRISVVDLDRLCQYIYRKKSENYIQQNFLEDVIVDNIDNK